MTPHLTPDLAARYRSKALAPNELIAVCDHLDACASCRQELEARMLLRPLHATYEELTAVLAGSPSADTAAHLDACPVCRGDLDQLRIARQNLAEAPRRRIWWPVWGIAFAGALAAAFLLFRPAMPNLLLPPELTELRPRNGVLLGDDAAPRFRPLEPIATLVADPRPVFRWEPLPTATAYRVEVFDPEFNPLASGDTTSTEWTPPQPLPRATILRWRVVARTPSGEVAAPLPPAPESRFRIVSEQSANRWDILRRTEKGKRLAIEAANLGLRQEALRLDPTLQELRW
jgi:hypothetical protein